MQQREQYQTLPQSFLQPLSQNDSEKEPEFPVCPQPVDYKESGTL